MGRAAGTADWGRVEAGTGRISDDGAGRGYFTFRVMSKCHRRHEESDDTLITMTCSDPILQVVSETDPVIRWRRCMLYMSIRGQNHAEYMCPMEDSI